MNELVDTVVVGAGPAGSAAAIVIASAGFRVLLIDRHLFPRDKPCGDLIGARAMRAARQMGVDEAEFAPYVRLSGAMLTTGIGNVDLAPGSSVGRRFLVQSDARVIPRSVFDDALVRVAVRRGAEFRRATVREVRGWSGDLRSISLQQRIEGSPSFTVQARAVVIAGGYGCRVAADIVSPQPEDGPAKGIARRGYFEGVGSAPDRIVFSLDRWLLPGYGWIFPLPNGAANVGVGCLARPHDPGNNGLETLWQRFTTDEGSPVHLWLRNAKPIGPPKTWPLDLGPRRRRLVSDGLLVAGEAAGLVGPLTGAGIAFALESGRLAGERIVAGLRAGDVSRANLAVYGAAIRRRMTPWLRAELLAQRYLTDPDRAESFFRAVQPLPFSGALGARLLLHLG